MIALGTNLSSVDKSNVAKLFTDVEGTRDWLRVGTDIVGGNPAPTFNAAYSLAGASSVRNQQRGFSWASVGWACSAPRGSAGGAPRPGRTVGGGDLLGGGHLRLTLGRFAIRRFRCAVHVELSVGMIIESFS